MKRNISVKGMVLDRQQLKRYVEKLSTEHLLKFNSDANTYPIYRVKENFKIINSTYNLLNQHIKLSIAIHPAGEWILDNYYLIEEAVRTVEKELTKKKYKSLFGLANGEHSGFSRAYCLASEIVAYTDCNIDFENITDMLKAYQSKNTLSMDEIWSMPIFLNIAIIENIRIVCEKIYTCQVQKLKVENMLAWAGLCDYPNKTTSLYLNSYEYKRIKLLDMRSSFVEYMSYKLKKYGKQAIPFLNVLEEEVNKTGTSVENLTRKEHFDVALKKLTLANGIKSIREINRINFAEVFESTSGIEELLNQDPSNVYPEMDYRTKGYYRNKIQEISKKTRISEIYITQKLLEVARYGVKVECQKKSHIGYYLISDGYEFFKNYILGKAKIEDIDNIKLDESMQKKYVSIVVLSTLLLALLVFILISIYLGSIVISVACSIPVIIPISEIVVQIIQYCLSKTSKSRIIPKMDYTNGVPEDMATFVVIPTIINKKERAIELLEKLEVYYLANKSKNMYFALLGDCSSSNKQEEDFDNEVIKAGIGKAKELSKKYGSDDFPIFHFLYRKREWNKSEKCYLGWERKRGLLNQFNEYLLEKTNPFLANTLDMIETGTTRASFPTIKNIITLDSDTDLTLNVGIELIGAMGHVLNIPKLSYDKSKVVEGYGVIQPRIGIDIESSRKTLFTKIYAGYGGIDAYANAVSDVYQDAFGEAIFTGKGIYNLECFSKVFKNKIPENVVLSHDLLEGSYLRCGLATDILLLDGHPSKYNAYAARAHRWIRGDWQILQWLRGDSPLNLLSKYKIFDNLRRSLIEPTALMSLIFFVILNIFYAVGNDALVVPITVVFLGLLMPLILDLINNIVFRKDVSKRQKMFSPVISGIKGSFYRAFLSIAFFPHKAVYSLDAIVRTIYRLKISKQNLLQWVTAEQAEKNAGTDVKSFYKTMLPNPIIGILAIIVGVACHATRIFNMYFTRNTLDNSSIYCILY